MKNLFLKIIKPNGAWAGWLIFLTLLAIVVAGLSGAFERVEAWLAPLTFQIGDVEISAWSGLRGALVIALIFWSAAIIASLVEHRVNSLSRMRSTTRVLVIKVFQIALYIIAFLIAMDLIGLDLTALTVFSGAVGIGLGFGLQKITSNFISGLILLFERSVEIDDLIEMPDGIFGFVRRSSARFTLVETFDGKEILIPNEDLITSRVINWTLSNSHARIEVHVGVSYGADLELARDLILEAAKEHPLTISDPSPQCFLRTFGSSSVDFTLYFWIDDVVKGRLGPQSEVMFAIWRKFGANSIEIPFPQQDIHIRTPLPQKDADRG
ncbi:mechanosensitive ion channel family protein [Maricaulis sp. CAU 1757]